MIDPILEYRYVHLAGASLDGFKKLRENIYNFRCPICGDSHQKNSKKRGYFLKKEGRFIFYCHNCGASMSLRNFLYQTDNALYQQFQRERLLSGGLKFEKKEEPSPFEKVKKFEIERTNLLSVSSLQESHPAYQYLLGRNVPPSMFHRVKWTNDFPKLVADTIGDKYSKTKLPKEGIIFELKEFDGKVTGYQIRSIDKNVPKSQRFVICSINDEHGFFYDTLNLSEPVYVIEGCTDSLFLNNSIAVLSSMLWKIHPSDNCIYVNDQEPRNASVCKQIEKCISLGYPVVLLPRDYENMDINDIVNSGVSPKELNALFQKHTYSGLKAKMFFAKWKK